ncbi:complexin-3a isoform 2-T2 [Clarias gariepinus]|uniref:complexin-3a isoform X2 n=1 Tax=Clarias gariepinus TaxID=13013 RepID=UPI00234D87D8|nr:complexin-3a isoform X2 [Clarias gariepinus]
MEKKMHKKKEGKKNKEALIEERECESEEKEKWRRGGASPRVCSCVAVIEREAGFAQKKAERATVRTHFREKYRLPKSELDETQIEAAGKNVELPSELAKMIAEDNQEEEHKQSVLGQLSSLQDVDIDQLKDRAQATFGDLKESAEKCEVM